jgi:hypothetical protein
MFIRCSDTQSVVIKEARERRWFGRCAIAKVGSRGTRTLLRVNNTISSGATELSFQTWYERAKSIPHGRR